MTARGVRAGRAFVEVGVDDRLTAGLRKAQQRLRAFGAAAAKVGGGLTAVGSVASGLFGIAAREAGAFGDTLDKMALRTGVSVEALSQLKFAAEQSGSDIGTLEKGIRRMATTVRNAERGLSTATESLSALGLSVEDLEGLTPDQQFVRIAEGLSQVEDATRRAAIAQEVFGRAGAQLLPLLMGGADGIGALTAEADALGLTFSRADATAGAAFTDAMNRLRQTLIATRNEIGAALLPSVTSMIERVREVAGGVREWVEENRGLAVTIAKVATGAAVAGVALLGIAGTAFLVAGAIGGLVSVIGLAATAFAALKAAVVAIGAPVIALGALFGAAGSLVTRSLGLWGSAAEGARAAFGSLRETAVTAFGEIVASLRAGDIRGALAQLKAAVKAAGVQIAATFTGFFGDAVDRVRLEFVTLWTVIQQGAIRAVAGVAKTFNGVRATFADVALTVASLFEDAFLAIGDLAADVWLGIKERLGLTPSQVADTRRAERERERSARDRGIAGDRAARREEIDSGRAGRDAAVDSIAGELTRGLDLELAGAAEAAEDRREQRIRRRDERLARIREDLERELAEIRARRGDGAGGESALEDAEASAAARRIQETIEALEGTAPGLEAAAESSARITSRGTFSSFRLGGFGGMARPIERTATAVEKVERTASSILEEVRTNLQTGFGVWST